MWSAIPVFAHCHAKVDAKAFLPQAEKAQNRDNDDHQSDDIDNVVHLVSPCDDEMPSGWKTTV
jgi:hypothetical protein